MAISIVTILIVALIICGLYYISTTTTVDSKYSEGYRIVTLYYDGGVVEGFVDEDTYKALKGEGIVESVVVYDAFAPEKKTEVAVNSVKMVFD